MVNVYVDVDGVLNAVSLEPPDWAWPDDRLSLVAGYPIRWSATMVARLNALAARPAVAMHWVTTWGERATHPLSDALGLDATGWPVLGGARRRRAVDTLAGAQGEWWKLTAVRRHLPAHTPAVWLDDDLRRDPAARTWVKERGDVLAISPATELALTPAHLDRIEAFVEAHASL